MSSPLTTPNGIVEIRPAIPADAAAVRELRLEALALHPESFAADHASTQAGSDNEWIELINRYADNCQGILCIAMVEGRLIGLLGLVRGHWPKTRHGGTIWGAYVKAQWRGLHVGEALLQECIAWGQANGLTLLKLGVVTSNTSAIRCYARCGFTIYGIDPQAIYYEEVYYEELLMVRSI
jgi:ribosomal protein S18 acetylase RimI-like enzyme